jgi:hypothetical protein
MLRMALLIALAAGTAAAAPGTVVRVDRKGSIRFSAAVLKKLGVRPDEQGTVRVSFPPEMVPRPPVRPPAAPEPPPDRLHVYVPLRKDRSLVIPRTPLAGGKGSVPGPPGTTYLAAVEDGRLVLKPQAPQRRGARRSR